jgi:hypothetical protein
VTVDRVLFVHVQRTGGTSLRRMIEYVHGTDRVHPSTDYLAARPGERYPAAVETLEHWDLLPDHRFLFGHFIAAVVDLLPTRYRPATMLRDPVDRSVSIIRLHAWRTGRTVSELLGDDEFLVTHVADLQTRVFGSDLERGPVRPQETDAADDAMLERARDRLATFEFVGRTEQFAASLAKFDHLFGTKIRSSPTGTTVHPSVMSIGVKSWVSSSRSSAVTVNSLQQ